MVLRSRLLVVAVLALCSCKQYVPYVLPPESPALADPDEAPCTEADAADFVAQRLDDIDACARHLVCEKGQARTVTLVIGCDGTLGSLSVQSAQDMGDYNECVLGKGESWDYGTLCAGVGEVGCAWSVPVDIECRAK